MAPHPNRRATRRLLIRLVLFAGATFVIFQLGQRLFYSSENHYSEPGSSSSHHALQDDEKSSNIPPARNAESLRGDVSSFWTKLARDHGLEEEGEVPVLVRRFTVSGNTKEEGNTGGRSGILKVKAPFLGAHGFTRPKVSQDSDKEEDNNKNGERKGFHLPLGSPLGITLPPSSPSTTDKNTNASSLLLATATSYSRALELIDTWSSFLTTTGTDKTRRSRSNGAGLLLALTPDENAPAGSEASEARVVEIRDLLWQNGVDASVFSPVPKTDTDKGNAHAQLFQKMMMARFGVGELGLSSSRHTKKWFGIIDADVSFPDLGSLLAGLESKFGGDDDWNGRWFVGLPGTKKDWIKPDTTDRTKQSGSNNKITYGGGAVLMSPSVLDTAGQLMCFQGGGKGLKAEDERTKKWDQMLYECLMDGDEDLRLQVLVGEGGYLPVVPPVRSEERVYATESKPLTVKKGDGGKKEEGLALPEVVVFRDGWVVYSNTDDSEGMMPMMRVTYYPAGVQVKKVKGGEEEKEMIKKLSDDRIVIHSPFPPETRSKWWKTTREKLEWTGQPKKKTWKVVETEVKELGGGGGRRKEVWQAYVNKKGGGNNGEEEGEEKSDVDSVIILIWDIL
ncbi:hypothetical protein QBC43DRAFT_320090 [Cladorrhinum sp. PSN259]|nr:hypothetical protein QBC43DRAFT_320090 [Cladorrhinum sp. PSN259]